MVEVHVGLDVSDKSTHLCSDAVGDVLRNSEADGVDRISADQVDRTASRRPHVGITVTVHLIVDPTAAKGRGVATIKCTVV